MTDLIRITRGIPNNIQNFDKFPSFDLCITQGLLENVGSAARMAQECSFKKRRVLRFETPDDQVKDRSDEVLLYGDEEASEFYVKKHPTKALDIQCVFNNGIKTDLIRNLRDMALELTCSSHRAFVMRFNGFVLRFTLREFALISELNCVSEEKDFNFDTKEPNSGKYNQFPWVKKAFYLLMKSLSKKLDSEKQFYKIGGMSIVIQEWLYGSSSINFQVAQKVDDHIPGLLNWQTAKVSTRYKKLMKTIFSDVNNKGIENQGEVQYSDSSDDESDEAISHSKDSDDDFQEPPPQTIKIKRKGKVDSSPSPVKKRTKKQLTDGSKQAAQTLEPRVIVKLSVKKDIVSKKVPKKPKIKLIQHRRILTFQEQADLKCKSRLKELSDFRKEVKQEFVDIRKLINDNFKTVLTAINSKHTEQEVRHSDDPIVPPNLNDK
ncbi:hypothetical protein H5410_047652 [Solanum commersonii]|uniref:Ulp1 protease family, C-terminal catalytic domain containing protein n=1 Tax=Solanum commersonii TaxID=4109 RepID=A0A9J5XHR0_SOLCO|nr:hypothetical protein H5410_047652 [Solanum commersonii]